MILQVFLGGDGAGGGESHRKSHQNLISKIFNWLPALAEFDCPSKKIRWMQFQRSSWFCTTHPVYPLEIGHGMWLGSFPITGHFHTWNTHASLVYSPQNWHHDGKKQPFEIIWRCISYLDMLVYWRIISSQFWTIHFFIAKTGLEARRWGASGFQITGRGTIHHLTWIRDTRFSRGFHTHGDRCEPSPKSWGFPCHFAGTMALAEMVWPSKWGWL